MAMRPRYRVGSQPRQSMRPTYEHFKPKFEWNSNESGLILLVYLPGFVKEQVKVVYTYVENKRLAAKVQGQRPLFGGRWSFFSELYRIPETCDINKIESQFQRGVLTIVMPNKKSDESQKGYEPEAIIAPETSSPQEIAEASASQERQREENFKNVEQDETSQKTTAASEENFPENPNNKNKKETTANEEKSQKGQQDEDSQKTIAASSIDTVSVGSGGESGYEKSHMGGHQVEASSMAGQIDSEKINISVEKPPPEREGVLAQKTEENEKSERSKGDDLITEEEKPILYQKTEEKDESERSKEDELISEKSKKAKCEVNSSLEGKQLLLNVGTTVLVILGFGAYLFYTVWSFGKA